MIVKHYSKEWVTAVEDCEYKLSLFSYECQNVWLAGNTVRNILA